MSESTTKEDIANKLKGIERYNPLHVDVLTEYLEAQCKDNTYDHEANAALLKLYQFNPALFKNEVVEKILLKALTNLPHPDFILCELLIDSSKLSCGNIQDIIEMHNKLELCQFRSFWKELPAQQELIADVVGFSDDIRRFICHVVGITYQNIKTESLKELLGFTDNNDEFVECLKKHSWKQLDDGFVNVASQEEKIKTINITEKIELEQVANILSKYC